MGFDFVGLMWEAPLVWNEFAKGFCTGVLGRARRLLSCGTRVATRGLVGSMSQNIVEN